MTEKENVVSVRKLLDMKLLALAKSSAKDGGFPE